MAEQLALVKTYDFQSDQGTVNLLTRTVDGFEPAYEGWTPNVTPDRTGRVQQAITLRVQGASTDAVAASLQKIADKSREVDQYFSSGNEKYAVWFRVQMSGETKGRQTLVQELRHEPASSVYDVSLRSAYHWNKYTLGISHAPWWEGTACGTISYSGSLTFLGGTIGYAAINGDLSARIASVTMNTQAALIDIAATHIFPNADVWIGVRSNRFGTANLFQPFWNFAPAVFSDGAGEGTAIADTKAKSGTALTMTSVSNTTRKFFGGVTLGTAERNHRGQFLALARARISGSGGEASLQLYTAYANDCANLGLGTARAYGNASIYPRVILQTSAGTPYKFYEMGVIDIPGYHTGVGAYGAGDYSFILYMQTISGTPSVWVDGICLVPTEGMASIKYSGNAGSYTVTDVDISLNAYNSPDGQAHSYFLTDSDVRLSNGAPLITAGIPPGDSGIIVVAGQNQGSAAKEFYFKTLSLRYFERWQEVRGND